MTRDQNETDVLREAMNEPDSRFSDWLRQLPTRVGLSVYEVNAHTTMGDASQEQRARWVDSPGVAIALARRLLQAARHGVTRQAVYKLSGFDTPVDQPPGGMVQLFGLTRELGPPARLRPSGQVLAELNAMDWSRTADAPCHGPACSRLVGRFFAADRQLAIVSGHETAVQVRWPCASPQPGKWRVRWLSASTGSRSDHAWQEVDLVCEGGQVRWTLPPWTLMLGKAT
jgi:hypothetical protein